MWPWTNVEDYMLMTEVQAQITGQIGQLPLFWQQTQSRGRASRVQAARACHSRQQACRTFKAFRVPQGSSMPACIREPTQSPKGASTKVVAMEEATESCWTAEQSLREGLMLRKYVGLVEGFVFKHLILICFTQQTEVLSFLKDVLFPSRDWKPLWWIWYRKGGTVLPGVLVLDSCLRDTVHMYQHTYILVHAYFCLDNTKLGIQNLPK